MVMRRISTAGASITTLARNFPSILDPDPGIYGPREIRVRGGGTVELFIDDPEDSAERARRIVRAQQELGRCPECRVAGGRHTLDCAYYRFTYEILFGHAEDDEEGDGGELAAGDDTRAGRLSKGNPRYLTRLEAASEIIAWGEDGCTPLFDEDVA